MHATKKGILAKSSVDIIVASKFMLDMAQNSPILENHRIHHISHGVDTNIFRKLNVAELRNKYKIDPNNLVISFRETDLEYKGLTYIKEALRKLSRNVYAAPITVLTIHEKGLLNEFKGKYQLVELGAQKDEVTLAEFYNCSDIFLMPSTAEAFGMMAIEAMACAKPVIAFAGTALSDILFPPAGGVIVPMKDSDALYAAIDRLLNNPVERKAIGDEAFRISRINYSFADHANKIIALYEDVISRSRCNKISISQQRLNSNDI